MSVINAKTQPIIVYFSNPLSNTIAVIGNNVNHIISDELSPPLAKILKNRKIMKKLIKQNAVILKGKRIKIFCN
jgi:hypothetical protein